MASPLEQFALVGDALCLVCGFLTADHVVGLRAVSLSMKRCVEALSTWERASAGLASRLPPFLRSAPQLQTAWSVFLLMRRLRKSASPGCSTALLPSPHALPVSVFAKLRRDVSPDDSFVLHPRGVSVIAGDASKHTFALERVFSADDASVAEAFDRVVVPRLCDLVAQHMNAAILLYGQSGVGKTTLCFALLPRVLAAMLDALELVAGAELRLTVTEVYCECAKVLVDAPVRSLRDAADALQRARAQRQSGETAINAQSSRSHALFDVTLIRRHAGQPAGGAGRLTLVDLAGSGERFAHTTTAQRHRESTRINLGLLALARVLGALGSADNKGGGKRIVYVPFRDSQLTRMLQPALLHGSAQFILCVDPAQTAPTLSTLRFGRRAAEARPGASPASAGGDEGLGSVDELRVAVRRYRGELRALQGVWDDVRARGSSHRHGAGAAESRLAEAPMHMPRYRRLTELLAVLENRLQRAGELDAGA